MTAETDSWHYLRQFTQARIALGRAGSGLPTRAHLQFQTDHAQARDAIYFPLNFRALKRELCDLFVDVLLLQSQALDRAMYLQRPDLGRALMEDDWDQLQQYHNVQQPIDIALVIADGLSPAAIQAHASPFLHKLVPQLLSAGYSLAPICLVEQGRVAIGDDIGEALSAQLVIVLIGERPGLSSPDSMGIYLTYHPKRGKQDSQRNCISNIRPQGLSYDAACVTTLYLIQNAIRLGLSGVQLKDETVTLDAAKQKEIPFLTPRKDQPF